MRLALASIFTLIVSLMLLGSMYLILVVQADYQECMSAIGEYQLRREEIVRKVCAEAWPRFGENYQRCLELGQVKL